MALSAIALCLHALFTISATTIASLLVEVQP
jgi:hypothetical protein